MQREYLTRVRTKVFAISTLLIPLGLIAYIGLIIGIQYWQSEPEQSIGIHDQNEVLAQRLTTLNSDRYLNKSNVPEDSLRQQVMRGEIDGYIVLTEEHINGDATLEFIYRGNSSITLQGSIRSDLREVIREELLSRAGVSDDVRNIFESRVDLESRKLTDEGNEEEDQTAFYTGLGFAMGLFIFFSLFMYGTIIMKGVIEEKSSRIVEVIASSVRPIELLTGKILGITCVALTQFVIWFILTALIIVAAGPLITMVMGSPVSDPALMNGAVESMDGFDVTGFDLPPIELSLIAAFFLYFILGYFIYSALFAVVGSAVDSEADTQQLIMPVMLLIIIAWIINVEVMQNPDSMISVVSSLFPFFAPINMVTRLAISNVPVWEVALSLFLMIGTIAGTMWLCARIYRVGILQYGDKAGFLDLVKWFKQN